MQPHVEQLQNPHASGDLWAGIAYSHVLSCRWNQVVDAVQTSIENYQAQPDPIGFEIAHTQWLQTWAFWHLGHWNWMFQTCDEILDDAVRRNDQFERLVVTQAYGCCAWLGRDRTSELDSLGRSEGRSGKQPMQLLDLFGQIGSLQYMIYEGRYDEAWHGWEVLDSEVNRMPYRKMQFLRIVRYSLGTLISLHKLDGIDRETVSRRISGLVGRLRGERLPFADVLANLYDGLLQARQATDEGDSRRDAARVHLHAARDQAGVLGLRPFELAAADALAEIDGGAAAGHLREAMRLEGIARPAYFERLYTVSPADAPGRPLSHD